MKPPIKKTKLLRLRPTKSATEIERIGEIEKRVEYLERQMGLFYSRSRKEVRAMLE